MLSRFRTSLYMVVVAFIFCDGLQAAAQSAEPEVKVYKRRLDWDRNRWVFALWTSPPPSHTNIEADLKSTVRENVRSIVTREQFDGLEAAFGKRVLADAEARAKIAYFEYSERNAIRKRDGWSDLDLARFQKAPAGWKEPTSEEKVAALREYVQAQDKAEKLWVQEIDEILPPESYSKVAAFFVRTGNSFLMSELFANYLRFDVSQRRSIEALCNTYQEDIERFKIKVGALKKGENLKPIDVEAIKRSLYQPYTVLSINQFRSVATISGLKREDESWLQFRDRISVDSKAGKDLLGPLVDRLIAEQ